MIAPMRLALLSLAVVLALLGTGCPCALGGRCPSGSATPSESRCGSQGPACSYNQYRACATGADGCMICGCRRRGT
jgi:hypothetical protein